MTLSVCGPAARSANVAGEVQGEGRAPSREQAATTSLSLVVNATEALVSRPVAGPETIVTTGAPVSAIQAATAAVASTFPAWSAARTASVCGPSASLVRVSGETHGVAGAPSRAQLKLEPATSEEKATLALEEWRTPLGAEVSVVCGGLYSPHAPGVDPSIRHRPPLWTFIA